MRYRNSREALGTVKNVTVSFSQGKWFVSIQTEREVETPVHPSTGILGIDMGIRRFATFDRPLPEFDDLDHLAPLNSFKRHECALRKAQKAMSRKTKFSNNWEKGESQGPANLCPYRPCTTRLPAQSHDHDQPKPRDGVYRGFAGPEYVQVSLWHDRSTGQKRQGQIRPE